MRTVTPIQSQLITLLADGLCHSGNELGLTLQVSRTAIWKQITQLIDLGLAIRRIPKQGYQLVHPMALLDEALIRQHIDKNVCDTPMTFFLYPSIDSTNRVLKEAPRHPALTICCAETQTQGRGRFGRPWYSPFGENIYCSSRWHFDCDLSRLSGLSLVVSLAIVSMLKEIGIDDHIRIKWPNDILWHDKKLSGSLIEIVAESNSVVDVIIGIGLNVNSDTQDHPALDNPWCSLYDIIGHQLDRNELIARLLMQLHTYLKRFLDHGFSVFLIEWETSDYLKNQEITVSQPHGAITGRGAGVNEAGQLILYDETGIRHELSAGDTSLHNRGKQ